MDVNDLPTSIRYGHSARHMLNVYENTMEAMLNRESGPLMLDVTAHTHVFGRPSGAWVFDEIMTLAIAQPEIWVTTREQMALYVLEQSKVQPHWLEK